MTDDTIYGVFIATISRRRRALELSRYPFLRYRAPPVKSPTGRILDAVMFSNPVVCNGENFTIDYVYECKLPVLSNKHGEIKVGTRVSFSVENQNVYVGPLDGILQHDGKDFYIDTTVGRIGVNTYLGAYLNTIRPLIQTLV